MDFDNDKMMIIDHSWGVIIIYINWNHSLTLGTSYSSNVLQTTVPLPAIGCTFNVRMNQKDNMVLWSEEKGILIHSEIITTNTSGLTTRHR